MDALRGILLPQQIRHSLLQESKAKLPLETGGILIGSRRDSYARIAHATGPGPKAVHRANAFMRDGNYVQAELDRVYRSSNGEFDYLGEWHSHPRSFGASSLDHTSLAKIAKNTAYRQPNPLLLICERQWLGFWRILTYRWDGKKLIRMRYRVIASIYNRADETS